MLIPFPFLVRSLNTNRMMKLNRIKMPQANPTVNALTPGIAAVTPRMEFTQLTSNTGAVCNLEVTAKVAPVSLTLRVKTMMAP